MATYKGDDEFQKTLLGILFLSYKNGLVKALEQLASFHDWRSGDWLDDVEAEVVSGIKTSVVEGMDMTSEANALQGAVAEATEFFAEFRKALASKTNSN